MKTKTLKYVSLAPMVPKKWHPWFFEMLAANAPFTWGDNAHSLVPAERLADHCELCLPQCTEIMRFIAKIRKLEGVYIDLET